MNKKCQVFTPKNYVNELLDSVEYKHNLYGSKILENSCGDGNILVEIVQRYIDDCKEKGFSRTKIKNGLEKDIYGIEIDKEQLKKCILELNRVLCKNDIKPVEWKIFGRDYLKWDVDIKFKYIVGNPPYITYRDLDDSNRIYLKETFHSCKKGKFDYCYAFIEKSIEQLDNDGKMSYLVPSSIFKTVFGKNLRDIMKNSIIEIKDYPVEKIFNEALVKSSIIVIDKNKRRNNLCYKEMNSQKEINISFSELGEKWYFTNTKIAGKFRFGDYFRVSNVVATLLNEAYVLSNENLIETDDGYICKNTINKMTIEKDVVRDTDTPRTIKYNKKEKIIFPYKYDNNGIVHYTAEEFEKLFPGAVKYLMTFKTKLDKRKKDKGALWFEYGRSQALNGLNCSKLLMSTVFTNNVEISKLSQQSIPYSGIYITIRSGNDKYSLDDAISILQSNSFKKYAKFVGIPISGYSVRISSKDVENYMFGEVF